MSRCFFLLLVCFTACTLPEKKKENQLSKKSDTTFIETNHAHTAETTIPDSISLPRPQQVKSPFGIYQTILPLENKMEQTIEFNKDFTYRLQEKYFTDKKDSVVITEGTWTPSDGFIWLYKDQIVRGRYKWNSDILQYYSPLVKKSFSMNHLEEAGTNAAWRNKEKQGVLVFGVGNEPFWNIELNDKDSISFLLSDWDKPLRLKIDSSFNENDGFAYTAHLDSSQIHVTIFPHFCSDGMSDFVYRNKVRVLYNQQVYNGCGIVYKK